MTVRYKLGCDLSYEVKTPTVFIFNLEVARLLRHQDLTEQLTITPELPRRTYVVPDIRNRYISVSAQPGPLSIVYQAEVTLDVFRATRQPSTRRRSANSRSISCLSSCPRASSRPIGFQHSLAANLATCRKGMEG